MHRTDTASHADRTTEASSSPLPKGVREVHILTLATAGIFLVYEATKHWFWFDEWDFLGYRGIRLGNHGIFYSHNGQWTTIPILIWRGLFNLVGVRDYWLYAIPMIVVHLAVVFLLWRLMLRHKVEPWTATLLAATFAVLGVGWDDLTFAFQLAFVGSVFFGLLAVEAIENDRLWLPAVFGTCALMCSDIGVPMVAACGLVALARRRPRVALFAVLPPAALFLIWYAVIGHLGTNPGTTIDLNVKGLASYIWTGLTASTAGLVNASTYVGALLVSVLAGAAVIRRNVPAALAASAVVLYIFIGLGRLTWGATEAAQGRYSYIAVALVLPLIGQLVTMLMRNRDLRPLVVSGLLLLIGVNFVVLDANEVARQQYSDITFPRNQLQAAAYLIQRGERFPGRYADDELVCQNVDTWCLQQDVPDVSVLTGWIRRGQFPVPTHVRHRTLLAEQTILEVYASPKGGLSGHASVISPGATTCQTLKIGSPATVELATSGALHIVSIAKPGNAILTVSFPNVPAARSTAVVVPVVSQDKWLNVPSGTYPTATIASSNSVRMCGTLTH